MELRERVAVTKVTTALLSNLMTQRVKRSVVMATVTNETRYPNLAKRIERSSDWFRVKPQ